MSDLLTIIGLFKTEVIRARGPGRELKQAEFATLEWVDFFNNRRLLEPIGYIQPVEKEQRFYTQQLTPTTQAGFN